MTTAAVGNRRRVGPAITWASRLGPVLAGAVAAAVVVAATTPHGPGLSPDSAVYLSTADALEHGRGFEAYGGVPLTDFPPGYPLALAGWLETVGGQASDAARAVNAASVFALVVLTGLVLRMYVRRGALRAAGVVLVAGAPSVLHTGVTAWSEPLFAACIMACLLFLARSLAEGRMLDIALAGAFASGCVMVRLVGVGVVLAGLVALVIGGGMAKPRGDVVRRCLVFLGVACLAPAAWLASRIAITDSPLGVRKPPRADLFENGRDAVTWMGHWLVPDTLSGPLRAVGYVAAAGALCVGLAMWSRSGPPRSRAPSEGLWLPALVAASVIAVTVIGASLTETDPLDFRLLAPALAPSVLLVIAAIDRLLDRRPGRLAVALAGAFLMAWMAAVVAGDAAVWREARKGEGYADAYWRSSELTSVLRGIARGAALYSNEPAAVWVLSDRDARCPSRALARVPCGGLSVPPDQRRDVRAPAYLAWFGEPDVGPVPHGRAGCRLSRVATLRDGVLFRVAGPACGAA
jgi:hypothetical protein